MIINGKEITGLYLYNPEARYTKGDIVYKDSTLYIALTEVNGVDPSDPITSSGKYNIYLGDRYVGIDEYLNYEKTEDSKNDKYIPASLLPIILNHYLTGVTDKGVIESLNDDYTSDAITTADEIIFSDSINHAIYSVSRDLGGLPLDLYSSESARLNKEKMILKQYTYNVKEFVNSVQVIRRVRVQELIDHSQYMVWYRYLKIDEVGSVPSVWKSISLNTTNVHDNILRLAAEYRDRIKVLQEELKRMRSNFRYHPLKINKLRSNKFSVPEEYQSSRMTVVVMYKSGNGIYSISNFTINPGSSITKYECDGIYLQIEDGVITLYEEKEMKTKHRKAYIDQVFIHEFYE